jgi:hypothetical protein
MTVTAALTITTTTTATTSVATNNLVLRRLVNSFGSSAASIRNGKENGDRH